MNTKSELRARRFNPKSDYPMLCQWWIARNQIPTELEFLPQTGFIVPEVCAGFIYLTDSRMALIEGLISNPSTENSVRDFALNRVVEALCFHAEFEGYRLICAFTKLNQVTERSKRHGFQVSSDTFQHVSRRL